MVFKSLRLKINICIQELWLGSGPLRGNSNVDDGPLIDFEEFFEYILLNLLVKLVQNVKKDNN